GRRRDRSGSAALAAVRSFSSFFFFFSSSSDQLSPFCQPRFPPLSHLRAGRRPQTMTDRIDPHRPLRRRREKKVMILVTGSTGKVGRDLVDGLLAEGAAVRALTRDPAAAKLPPTAELAHFDPEQPETMSRALVGIKAVFINATAVGSQINGLMAAAA